MILIKYLCSKQKGTDKGNNELNDNIKVTFYELDKEKEMIADAFKIIEEFPICSYIQWR